MKWYFKCLKQYADFSGRARRKEYWWFMLINFIIGFALMLGLMIPMVKMGFNAAASGAEDIDEMKNPFMYIYIIYYFAVLIPSIAVTVRRLHDIGKSGYWAIFIYGSALLSYVAQLFQITSSVAFILFGLASFVIIIISLVWMFTNSDYGPNQYGPNPKGEGNPTEEVSSEQ